jgi:hypothetical protein
MLALTDPFLPSSIVGWATFGGLVLSGLWAILTFWRNNRIKAAEILLSIETAYSRHIGTLLKIEYMLDYEANFKAAVRKAAYDPNVVYDNEESAAINELEDVLRHFFMCSHVRRLHVDSGTVDRLCAYYLRVLCSESRPELREYIRRFWPTIYFWSDLAGKPWPRRMVIRVKQILPRLKIWWSGSYAEPLSVEKIATTDPASISTPRISESGRIDAAHGGAGPSSAVGQDVKVTEAI